MCHAVFFFLLRCVNKRVHWWTKIRLTCIRATALCRVLECCAWSFCVLFYFTACMLYYCNTVGWAWWYWGLIWWLTILHQCFDTVGWVTWPVKISSPNDLYCVEWDVKPYSTQLAARSRLSDNVGHMLATNRSPAQSAIDGISSRAMDLAVCESFLFGVTVH